VSVIVQYIVKVQDVDRFVATSEKYAQTMEELGSRNGSVYEDENEPGLVSTISEWDSHDQMHAASEKVGDDFNREAGTEGSNWTTHIWQKKGSS
jgi:quinol monooxygenase YgiN